MSDRKRITNYRWMAIHVLLLAVVVVTGWYVTDYLGNRARQEILEDNQATSLLLTTHLTGELNKVEGAVKALAGSSQIPGILTSHRDQDIVHANEVLDRYNSSLDVSVSYVMDVNGYTVASSNRNDPDSFVGKSYQFRPYFTQAMEGKLGRYFALGVTSLKRGFYASFPVRDHDGNIIGIAAMKKDLDGIEHQLKSYPYCFFVNQQGIIFLSSNQDMLMKSLWPVQKDVEKELLASKQFGDKPFDALISHEVVDGTVVALLGNTYIASRKVINPNGWSIVFMAPTDRITIYKSVGVILTMVVCLLIIIPLVFTFQTVRSAEAIHRSEERFQQVAQSSQDWIWETDREGRYTYSSQAVKHILDYEPEEMIGKYYYDFFVPERREQLKQIFKGFSDQKESFFRVVNRRIHRDGHHIFLESTGVPLIDAQGKVVGYRGTNRDITESKQAEEMLRESEQRLYRVIQSSPIPAFVIGKDHRVIYWNNALAELSSIRAEEVFGTTEHWRAFYKEQRPCMADLLVDEVQETMPDWYAGRYTKSKLVAEAYEATDYFPDMGEKGKWLRFTAAGIRDFHGNLVGAIETLEDITDSKRAEEEKENLEKGLLHAQKMEAIGTLAGGIAHDFNNLLMGIQGYASLMLLTTDEDHPNYNRLKSIEALIRSGANLTAQLLGFARGGRYEVKPTNLNEIVKSTSSMFGRTRKEITIHQKYQEDIWPVEVDRGQIEQVLLNLYVNAWQAMPGGGEIYLDTENVILDEDYAKSYSVKAGNYVKISVTDTGVGMDEKTRQRIFEPFFTTKEMGRGTGLGLATVYGIVKGHNGYINVYSEKGGGTTFTVYLPASEKEVTSEVKTSEKLIRGHEAILLIDDEDLIITVTRDILENLGYSVRSAKSGHEAVEIYRSDRDMIDLVILDMVMPDMGGGETFDLLKEVNPDVKVILSSGYSLNGQAIRIMERGCHAFIQKPFTLLSLSQKVRDVLDNKM
ncbi:MAG TPA: PAS domain S-box protein [Syntrophales bacterium]|nr:PAS domain S-box protein [Syntrophales bacterium]